MAMPTIFLLLVLIFIKTSSATVELCRDSCSPTTQQIRFPFGLDNKCSYPGFNLTCDSERTHTILTLPRSGNFIVHFIDYRSQEINIRDPDNCLAKRFLKNFSLSGSPFVGEFDRSFIFFNCSSKNFPESDPLPTSWRLIKCLSSENFSVVAIPSNYDSPVRSVELCKVMKDNVEVPVSWSRSNEGETTLLWSEPDCRGCEQRGGACGFKDDSHLHLACYDQPSSGSLPRSAKYGIIIGVGIPGLLCIVGLGCCLCGKLRTCTRGHPSAAELTATFPHPPSMSPSGLDGPTIELYPKTLLGESRRLPKPNDNTCPICLCEYQPKETLRTIPECNHYFHAQCIDEWLKMNATCPVCRNSPDVSSMGTPISSLSSSSSLAATPSSFSASSSSLSPGR